MSFKILLKNLNLNELSKDFSREIDSLSSEIKVEDLISRISSELNLLDASLIGFKFRFINRNLKQMAFGSTFLN